MHHISAEKVLCTTCTPSKNLPYICEVLMFLKGLLNEIFRPIFGCIDVSRPECEPLLLLKLI
jgi:hypothetical protein